MGYMKYAHVPPLMNTSVMIISTYLIGSMGDDLLAFNSAVKASHLKCKLQSNPLHFINIPTTVTIVNTSSKICWWSDVSKVIHVNDIDYWTNNTMTVLVSHAAHMMYQCLRQYLSYPSQQWLQPVNITFTVTIEKCQHFTTSIISSFNSWSYQTLLYTIGSCDIMWA